MDETEYLTVDFTGCRYYMDVYYRIRDALHFPAWFGCNVPALWDLIREPWDVHITFEGTQGLTGECKHLWDDLLPIFERARVKQAAWDCDFQYEIHS